MIVGCFHCAAPITAEGSALARQLPNTRLCPDCAMEDALGYPMTPAIELWDQQRKEMTEEIATLRHQKRNLELLLQEVRQGNVKLMASQTDLYYKHRRLQMVVNELFTLFPLELHDGSPEIDKEIL